MAKQIKSAEEKKLYKKNIIIAVNVIAFLVLIISLYFAMVYKAKRENTIKSGELIARESADKVEKYLDTNTNTLKMAAYALDEMIAENQPDSEIQEYLVSQSTAIRNAILENSTGLYGYINGRFFSGTNWVPPEDYDATARPWYTNAIEHPGEVAMLDPYVDVQSGNVMLAIGKTLCDGVSVISVDISLDRIQKLTEDAVLTGNSDIAIVLNDKGEVIAHSNLKEVGKNYYAETDTLGAKIINSLNSSKDYAAIDFQGSHYIVYMAKIQNGWYCISVTDVTSMFHTLIFMLVITIGVVITVVLIISLIMWRSNKRALLAEKARSQLSSIANIYMTVHEVDILTDTFITLRSDNSLVTEMVAGGHDHAQETVNKIIIASSDEAYLEDTLRFVNISTLTERMADKDSIVMEYMNKEGLWRRVRFLASQRDEDGRLLRVMWLSENVTDEKREREQLIDLSERAMAASEAKSEFLSNMSHEIRTPINAVLGMNEMILRESDDRSVIAYAENIKSAGHNLLGLINDILDFSKIEAGKIEIIPEKYDLSSMVNDLMNLVYARAEERGLVFNLEIDKNTPKFLVGDVVRVKQVITNIFTNAVKYTEKGRITFIVGYKVAKDDPNSIYLNVAVTDTGIGIKEEDLKRLTSRFERIEEKRNRNIEGTGLGMSITRSLLEMMGSELKVKSVYGKGSTFSFSLRQQVSQWDSIGEFDVVYREQMGAMKKYKEKFNAPEARILMVDDNPMNLIVFKSLVKQTGVKVDTAESGAEGIRLTQERKYDILFLDHMMPEKDGIEVLQEIREFGKNPNADTPAVCLTANAIHGAREFYMDAGFDDYLTKPVDPELLEELMIKYLPEQKVVRVESEDDDSDKNREEIPEHLLELTAASVDVRAGVKNSGSVDAYLSLLRVFKESEKEKAAELDKYYTAEDMTNYAIKVHALKSSARIIGAAELGEEAQHLEDAGKAEDMNYIREHHADFMADYKALVEQLAPHFPDEETDEDKPEASEDIMQKAYAKLREGAEDMDCECLEQVIDEMKNYHIPEAEAELFAEVKTAVEKYEYDLISDLLSNR